MTAPLVTEAEKEAAYKAITEHTFVPHELPLDDRLDGIYRQVSAAALEAAARVREDERRELVEMVREMREQLICYATDEDGSAVVLISSVRALLAKYEAK